MIQPADRAPSSAPAPQAPSPPAGLLDRLAAEERRQRLGPPSPGLAALPAWGPLLLLADAALDQPAGLVLLARLLRRRPDLLVLAPQAQTQDSWLALSRGDFGPLERSVRRAPWHALRQLRLSGSVLLSGAASDPRPIPAALAIQAEAQLPIWPLSAAGGASGPGPALGAFELAADRGRAEERLRAALGLASKP